MGTSERREREKENLRELVLEAARDIVSEGGLDALSMRALAERIEYSPATIYLYFQDKDELLRGIVGAGFERMTAAMAAEMGKLAVDAPALERYAATGRAYARFALENTAYFRVMFELPKVAQWECPEPCDEELPGEGVLEGVVALVREAARAGQLATDDPERTSVIGWGLIHGLVSLYLSGHLAETVRSHEDFMELIEGALAVFGTGFIPRDTQPA